MSINWNLGLSQDVGATFMNAFEAGKQRRQQDEQRNALAAYAQNPNENSLNALAQFDPRFVVEQKRAQQTSEQEAIAKRVNLVGQAAQFADTPEKWDAAVEYLSQQYPDLAQYRGKFTPELRMSAIASAGQMKDYYEQNGSFTLAPGSKRFDAGGQLIAEAPFAPRPVTVGEGQTVVEYAPGNGAPSAPGDIWGRMIHTESRGNQFGANGKPLTSPAGAIGIAQVMPGTAPEAARLAGLPFDENRYRTDPQYNEALGKAYFEKQLSDFGDPAKAVAAYNAGPARVRQAVAKGGENWQQYLPQETKGYLASVLGGGARVLATGAPKQENPPAGYRWKADGTLEPIPGGPAADKNAPGGPSRKAETDLRKEFNALPLVKSFTEMRQAMGKILAVRDKGNNVTAQDDMSLIFGYMRMLDPTSVVREGEYATAQNATGIPDQVRNLYNRAIDGNRLNVKQRGDMIESAARNYIPVRDQYNQTVNQYHGYARDYGLDPNRVAKFYVNQAGQQRGGQASSPQPGNGWGRAKVVP